MIHYFLNFLYFKNNIGFKFSNKNVKDMLNYQ